MKRLILILLTLMCAAAGMAQEAVVKSFEAAPMDVTAQQFARPDKHGNKCALVKVMVVAPNVSFQGNVMGDVQKRGSEYWVYMTEGTKMLRISADSFLAFMYDFPEPLQGGVTYMLTINAPHPSGTASVPQKKKQNFLALTVTPPTAHVTIDGTEQPVENGTVSKLLPSGTHTFRITAPGYAPVEESVTIADQKVMRSISLRSVKPRLTVSATTPGTEIFINEAKKGHDNWSGELFADSYVIEGRLNAHRSNSQTVTLTDNETRTVTIPALTPITGSLSIDYKPFNASVSIDGSAAGTTPLLADDILIGTHRVEISAPGYTPATISANVTEAATATISGSLTQIPTHNYAADVDITNNYRDFRDYSTGKYGFKHNGTIVIPAIYDWTWPFSEGLAAVELNGKFGFIDKSGTMAIPAKYDGASSFSEDLARVLINGRWGFIDKCGNVVIAAKYNEAYDFSEGLAAIKLSNNRWGFIDKKGSLIILTLYDDVNIAGFNNGKAKVKLNGRWVYIDRNGNEVK